MKCLLIHNRRTWGPKESSWFTFHHIKEELEKRGELLGPYSSDFDYTDDNNNTIDDKKWLEADCIFTVFGDAKSSLRISRIRNIPSFLEINYACGEIVNPFIEKELLRLGLAKDEILYEYGGFGSENYELASYVIGAGNKNYTEKTYHDYGINRAKFFKAGIDTEHFKPNIEERMRQKKIRFTLTASQLAFRKGIIHAFRAWRKLPKNYQNKIELHLFGRIPYAQDSLKEYNELMKDFPNVIHHPFMSNQSKEYVYEHGISHIMLCPTLAEGQSATALESMSFGLYPIVSPYTGSNFEKIPGKILSENPSLWIDEIAQDIKYVVDNFDEIKKTNIEIRNHAIKNYNYLDFSKEVVDFMEEIVSDNEQIKKWEKVDGDNSLRLNYKLDENSIVIDGGGFQGEWSKSIYKLYNPYIYIFEALPQFAEQIRLKFSENNKVKIIESAMGNIDKEDYAYISKDSRSWNSTSLNPIEGWDKIVVKKIDFNKWLKENNINKIDLLKLNIEGGEYDVMEQIVNSDIINNIENIQIQFHRNVENYKEKRDKIRNKLMQTHNISYNFDYVWENWSKKKND